MMPLESRLRLAVYEHFRYTGQAPDLEVMAADLGVDWGSASKALLRLHDLHALVLSGDPDQTGRPTLRVRMAHPFSGVPTDYTVRVGDTDYPANCAWDALAVLALLGRDGISRHTCPVSDEPLTLEVREGRLVDHGGVVHFAVPARAFWEDVGFT